MWDTVASTLCLQTMECAVTDVAFMWCQNNQILQQKRANRLKTMFSKVHPHKRHSFIYKQEVVSAITAMCLCVVVDFNDAA